MPDADDRRAIRIAITDEGYDLFRSAAKVHMASVATTSPSTSPTTKPSWSSTSSIGSAGPTDTRRAGMRDLDRPLGRLPARASLTLTRPDATRKHVELILDVLAAPGIYRTRRRGPDVFLGKGARNGSDSETSDRVRDDLDGWTVLANSDWPDSELGGDLEIAQE